MGTHKKESAGISRRDFARGAAVAAAGAACLPVGLVVTPITSATELQVDRAGALSYEEAEIDAKVEAILRKYGERLSEAQKADIRRLVTEGQKPLARMRAFALDNADQPGNVMKIYPDAAGVRRPASRSVRRSDAR